MRLEQLQYFAAVVDCGTVNKAAEKLNITQPALTKAVRSLEEELGVQLLVRSKRGCVPTSYGERVYEDCRYLLNTLDEMIVGWKKMGTLGEGSCVIPVACIPSAVAYLSERILPAMRKRYPNIEVVLQETTVYALFDFMRQGHARLAVTALTDEEEEPMLRKYRNGGFTGTPLLEDEYRVFLSATHPLSGKRELSVEECLKLRFVTYSNQYKVKSSLFNRIAEALGVKDFSYVASREQIMRTIFENRAAGVFLERMTSSDLYIERGFIRTLPVTGKRLCPSRHFLVALPDNSLSHGEKRVARFLKEEYRKLSTPESAGGEEDR